MAGNGFLNPSNIRNVFDEVDRELGHGRDRVEMYVAGGARMILGIRNDRLRKTSYRTQQRENKCNVAAARQTRLWSDSAPNFRLFPPWPTDISDGDASANYWCSTSATTERGR